MAWSAATLVTPPAQPAVSLAAAKQFLRIDAETDDFDAQLTSFAAAAVEQVEAMCSIRLAPQTIEIRADEWSDLLRLPIGPVTAIVTVHYQDRAGGEQLLDAEACELFGAGLETGIRLALGFGWPNDVRPVNGAIRVRLNVGYEVLPGPVWAAVLYHVGDLFAFRETAVAGGGAMKVPMSTAVAALLANYRIWQ
ncbi:MAG TPA: hypothetical protein PKD99_02285 [Sphingopyxis sp.]|nr:hypothetical protein [Sphingopyxis sp.]HMP43905.1 hypothetical protein [Sphingopyxis sp.]HMQ18072.1 hypothetical protein [Sphingopyxis sp.]